MKLLIAGDTVPTPSNYALFESADLRALVGEEIENLIAESDFFILNLEAPLVDEDTPIAKCGPNLRAPTNTIAGLQAMKPGLISLANNHIMDHGKEGLYSTLDILRQAKIAYIGVGKDFDEAAKPYIIDVAGRRIGVYSCAEHEFSIATHNTPGANPFDPLESLDHIVALKGKTDYVIVLYHGGKEHYRYPSPNLQKACRRMVDKGADLVVCQHSHCIGCKEEYRDATIVYGQGNFIFDRSESEFWQTSLLIEVDVGETLSINYIPLCKEKSVVRIADVSEAEGILSDFHVRSEEISQPGVVDEKYANFARSMLPNYLQAFHGRHLTGLAFRGLNKLSGGKLRAAMMRYYYKHKNLLAVKNYIECEAQRELLLKGLGVDHE